MGTYPATAHPETDVVVVGESVIDIIDTNAGPVEFPGGSGMNVAFGVGRLGISTTLLTALGSDERSRRIREHLHSAGASLHPGAEHLHRTSTARALLNSSGSAEYEFHFEWDLPEISPTFLPKVLHTGSLAAFMEPGATKVRSLLELVAGHCLITYDPNIRPALLDSHTEALTSFENTVPLATVVKLSADDSRWLYPGTSHHDVTSRLLQLGTKLAIITDGESGSYLRSDIAEIEVVGRHGANPPTRAELNAFLELIQASGMNPND